MKNCFQQKILNKFVSEPTNVQAQCLFPPSRPLYSFIDYEAKKLTSKCTQIQFLHDKYDTKLFNQYHWIEQNCYIWEKRKGKSIIIMHIKNKSPKGAKNTIIFSHNLCTTLGNLYSFLYDLSTQSKCDIISYDYSGYGKSTGTFCEEEVCEDIEAVGDFASYQQIGPSSIILMGQSIGCIPSIYYGNVNRNIGGIILISPFTFTDLSHWKNDNKQTKNMYNTSEIRNIYCPIWIIHGKKDDFVSYNESLEMSKQKSTGFEWYPRNANHINIFTIYRRKFYKKFHEFVWFMNSFNKNHLNMNVSHKYSMDTKSTVEDEKQELVAVSTSELNMIKKEEMNDNNDNNIVENHGYENSVVCDEENNRTIVEEYMNDIYKKRGGHKKMKFM